MYKILIVPAFICIVFSVFKRPRKMKLKSYNRLNRQNILFIKLDKIISKSKYFYKTKEEYISKLQLINFKSYESNNELILKYMLIDTAISIMMILVLSRVITMWYAVIIITLVFFYIVIFFGVSYIESKINKIHSQFPVALQCFMDEYIIHKNIKLAINSSYIRMPRAIGGAFEMLARELSGEKNFKISIKKFANELSYIWGHSFAEILVMSYEGAGDITEDLMTLNKLVSEEITSEEEDKSSRFENKITFIIIYVFALAGIIINILNNSLASYLYFYTSTGNALIAAWLIILIVRITFTSLSERGSR